jgi:kynurenine formamidase
MWHDLSQPFHGDMPHSVALPAPEFETVSDISEERANVQYYSVPTHIGTHVDAPLHFVEGGRTIDEFGIDKFSGEGVVLDVSRTEAEEISLADVKAADGEVQANDIVVFYTGWYQKYGTDEYDPHPWLADEVADWLVERDVKMIAIDTITPDLPGPMRPDDYSAFPIHRTLLPEEILVAEHLGNLEHLTGQRLEIIGAPIKIRGGDGAPARFIAREL